MKMNIKIAHESFCNYQITMLNYSPKTIENYETTFKIFLRRNPGIEEIEQVNEKLVRNFFFKGRLDHKWKSTTFISHHKRLNVFFKWAIKQKMISDNPFLEIEKPRLEHKLPTRLTKQEAFRVLEVSAMMSYSNSFLRHRNHAIMATFLYCGLRKGELLNLKFTDVDLFNMVIHVMQGKGNKDRVVPIPQPLKVILERYLREREQSGKTCFSFFASYTQDRGYTASGLKKLVSQIKEKAEIHFYIHMLRHTFATLMLEGGCDIYSLSKMLGHNDIKTTTIYLSASVEHLREQMKKHPLGCI